MEIKFRVVVDDGSFTLTTHLCTNANYAMDLVKKYNDKKCIAYAHEIKHNSDPNRADYEYRNFDIVDLTRIDSKFGVVYTGGNEPEFHGFHNTLDEAFDYIDEYWHQKSR